MNGHGSKRACHLECEQAVGIRASYFADLLKFFNDVLSIDLLGIQSCNWTAKRIFHMMKKQFGYKKLHFSIITPLKSEKTLWLGSFHSNCTCGKHVRYYSFFEGMQKIIVTFKGKITRQIKKIINQIDTINIRKNKNQCATIVAAETDVVTCV